jgi:CheY-like chemotaxis protein
MSATLIDVRSSATQRICEPVRGQAARMHGRILVAADSSDGRATISGMLECMGLEVEVANDGRVAFQRAFSAWQGRRSFDLVIMEAQMPEIDGYEATALLRSVGYAGRIIVLAACTFQDAHNKSIAAGCDGYASKPVSCRTLRNAIERHLPKMTA